MPQPARPIGNSREAIFWQWAYDEAIADSPRSGPGVLTHSLTRATLRRVLPRQKTGHDRTPDLCSLPVLQIAEAYQPGDPGVSLSAGVFFRFGWWKDGSGGLHLWNTELVTHDGANWARFTNTYLWVEFPTPAGCPFGLLDQSECLRGLRGSDKGGVQQPAYQLDPTYATGFIPYGAHFDLEIPDGHSNSGIFFGEYSVHIAKMPPGSSVIVESDGYAWVDIDESDPNKTMVRGPTVVATPY